ncbi:MAG: hypothetical protein QW514_07920, partial [Thermoprotei archaeon]
FAPFRDWGPHKAELAKNIRVERMGVPVESLWGVVDKGWRVPERTMRELFVIEKESGVLDSVKNSAKDVVDMVEENGKDLERSEKNG